VTVQGLALANLSAGVAQILLDNTVVASHNFGAIDANEWRSARLAFSGLEPAGTHLLAIQFLRPTLVSAGTPYQYIQAVSYTGIEAPEPHSFLLLSLGLAVLAARGRKVVGPNPARAHFLERNRVRN
jgi:hypothetical protein